MKNNTENTYTILSFWKLLFPFGLVLQLALVFVCYFGLSACWIQKAISDDVSVSFSLGSISSYDVFMPLLKLCVFFIVNEVQTLLEEKPFFLQEP